MGYGLRLFHSLLWLGSCCLLLGWFFGWLFGELFLLLLRLFLRLRLLLGSCCLLLGLLLNSSCRLLLHDLFGCWLFGWLFGLLFGLLFLLLGRLLLGRFRLYFRLRS